MRRADRLFHIIQLIRGRRQTTAAFLAQRLEVSERTIYRDVSDLLAQGVPIEGAAGVGYRLGAGFDLPPMMFTHEEAKALVASVRLAQVWLDRALGTSAQDALGKILSVLPAEARAADRTRWAKSCPCCRPRPAPRRSRWPCSRRTVDCPGPPSEPCRRCAKRCRHATRCSSSTAT